ncbi:MAG: methyltransferase domain-containing protein [Dehalococcoidales bacterium]
MPGRKARDRVVSGSENSKGSPVPGQLEKGYRMAFNFNSALFRVLVDTLRPGEGERVLDLGCSRGYYVRAMEGYTTGVVGVDISDDSLQNAVTSCVKYGDITRLDFPDSSFDKAYSLHTIEHLPDLEAFFAEVARVLKPGGTAVVVYPWEPFRGMQAIVAAMRQYHNPVRARSIHLHRLTPGKIRAIVAGSGLVHRESRLVFAMGVQYMTVLKKDS